METTSRAAAQGVGRARRGRTGRLRPAYGRRLSAAAFPWYGLDEAFTGPRWLMQVGAAADGTVEHGSIGHGDEPSITVRDASGRTRSGSRSWSTVAGQPRTAQRATAPACWRPPRSPRRPGSPGRACCPAPGPARWTTRCATTGWTSRPRPPGSWPTTWAARTGRRCRCRWTACRRRSTTASPSSAGCWPARPRARACTSARTGAG